MDYTITDFYNEADGKLYSTAINKAIVHAFENGGGRVVIPSGRFISGPVILKSNVELHLEAGAVLFFSDNPTDFAILTSNWEGAAREVYASCVYACDAINVSVTGLGTIDGNGGRWWDMQLNHRGQLKYARPRLISFINCENVMLRDITLINSPSWTVHPLRCNRMVIDSIKIKNPANSPNTDGIDPESCKNVHITNCFIDVGDDCIAIKSGTEELAERIPSENINISGCTMVHGHGGIVLGSEMSGGIRNVVVSNCIFQDTDRGIRLKSRRGRGGTVEDLRVSNIIMEGVICPFVINMYYFCGDKGKDKYVWDKNLYPITEETPRFRRLYFTDISARNVHAAAGFIYGLAERYVSDVVFSNIQVSMAEDAIPGLPAMMSGIDDMKQRGFFIGFAENVRFRNVTIENHEQSAFYFMGTRNISVVDCSSLYPKHDDAMLVTEGTVVC